MPQIIPDIATVLKDHGMSVTKQRLLVFELLQGKEPMTMYELYELAKGRLDRASLYRIVSLYEELGVVSRINIGWKYKIELSEVYSGHHHHLTCLGCHQVIAISEDELEAFITKLANSHQFQPVEHQIELQGYCQACAAV